MQTPNKSVVPQRPAPLTAGGPSAPQAPQPARPTMPQAPQAPQPAKPVMPQAPQAPQAPGQPQTKGFFTNAVRTVANAITGGAMERDIQHEQDRAVRLQANADQTAIEQANTREQQAVANQIRAEREAQRASDRRSMEAVDGIDVVRGRAIWNIQPGEIARKISEIELEEIEQLKGVIIQEGCTALVFSDGNLVATLSGGSYIFGKSMKDVQKDIEKALEEDKKNNKDKEKKENKPTFRELGIVGEVGRAIGWVGRVIFGEKKNQTQKKAEENQKKYIDMLLKAMRENKAPILSVYLVTDRYITLTFGGEVNNEGGISFKPYTIPVGIHNVEMGVSLQMQINDIHAFATNYLQDRKSVTAGMIQQILSGSIETLLRQNLRNAEYQQSGLPADLVNTLKVQIAQTINQQVYGITCTQVLNITDDNQDFERFRSVERELFNTEKELDFMHRTGEFRNRMENEANAQEIQSAQNAEQLRYALQQINKDQLIHDDELEEFVLLLESQKRLRIAKTQEEEFEALEDLRKNKLVKEDEMEALENALAQNKIAREEVTQIMRITSQQNIDTARMHSEWALDDARTDHDWEREELERRRNWGIEDEEREREWIQEEKEYNRDWNRDEMEYNRDFERKVREDDYDFAKMMRERELKKEDEQLAYERERQAKLDAEAAEDRALDRQMSKLERMAAIQAQENAQKYEHEARMDAQRNQRDIDLASIQAQERMNYANMSAEQIRAAQLEKLSAEAQVAMANAYGSDKENELLRQQAERDREAAERERENSHRDKMDMMNFAKEMAAMVRDTSANINLAQAAQVRQLQEETRHYQERVDHVQDNAMGHISQVSTAAANNINNYTRGPQPMAAPQPAPQPQAQMIDCACYQCGQNIRIAAGTPQCPICGAPFQW